MSINRQGFLKMRPAFNVQVKGNAKAFWRYAIKATVYLLRKQRQAADPTRLQKKRKSEMLELSEVYRLQKINEYLRQAGSSDRVMHVDDKVQVARFRNYRSEALLEKRRRHLEYKLQAEQIVVALKKAEKESQVYIDEHQQRSGWRAWVPSMLKTSYWYGNTTKEAGAD